MFLEFHKFTKFLKEDEEGGKGGGGHTSFAGTTFEHLLTHHINYYARQREKGHDHEKALNRTLGDTSRVRPSGLVDPDHPILKAIRKFTGYAKGDPKKGRSEYDRIAWDAKQAAAKVINHIHHKHGEVTSSAELPVVTKQGIKKRRRAASHMGTVTGGGGPGADQVLGKKTNADVLVNVRKRGTGEESTVRILGASLKYSTSDSPGSEIKVHTPTRKTLTDIIETHHQMMHGKEYGLETHVDHARAIAATEYKHVHERHDGALSAIFGRAKPFKNHEGKTAYFYPSSNPGPQGKTGLNDAALSHIRHIIDPERSGTTHPHRDAAAAYYEDLNNVNLKQKRTVSNHFSRAIESIVSSQHPAHVPVINKFLRALTNIPHRKNKAFADTLVINTTRRNDRITGSRRSPKVDVYNATSSLERITDNHRGAHAVKSNPESTTLNIGRKDKNSWPIGVVVDFRPGSAGGGINVKMKTSSLVKTGSYQ